MSELEQGLHIVIVGISGVFVNLLVLMAAVMGIGKVFGKKKKKKKTKPAPEAAALAGTNEPSA